jgi:hypothetical protein
MRSPPLPVAQWTPCLALENPGLKAATGLPIQGHEGPCSLLTPTSRSTTASSRLFIQPHAPSSFCTSTSCPT